MAIDPDLIDVVREALDGADHVDASAIEVASADDALVLRGGVATHEESAAAVAVAEQHADVVRSELRVDGNLREGVGEADDARAGRRTTPSAGTADPAAEPDDVVDDMQESLSENVSWDPPHEPVEVPTRAEARGRAGNGGGDDDADTDAGTAGRSLPDMSAEELGEAAHPRPREEETA